jgi:hypothetical protein
MLDDNVIHDEYHPRARRKNEDNDRGYQGTKWK